MSPFTKLRDPASYVACEWDLSADLEGRTYWVEFFKRHLATFLTLGKAAGVARGCEVGDCEQRALECVREFEAHFDSFHARPREFGRVSIIELGAWRNEFLWKHGFEDCFIDLKDRENASALPLLPKICREIDSLEHDPAAQLRAVIEGVFAGNIFDMGAEATAKQFLHGGPDFFATRAKLPRRPWLIDSYDPLAERWLGSQRFPRHVVFFIDNAGADFLLGVVPMIRYLAHRGARVTMAANEKPTLNDMTVHDVKRWWPRVLEMEPSLVGLPIDLVSTGTGEPLIDLSRVSDELNRAAEDADLVILEGMGRGVESNLDAAFSCDALNLAMLKDLAVASRIGGGLYDVICRFR